MFQRWKLALFIAASLFGVLVLVALPGLHDDRDFDARTGRRDWQPPPPPPAPPPPPTARERGDAAAELLRLRALPSPPAATIALLETELAAAPKAADDDPRLLRLREVSDAPALLEILRSLEDDAETGPAVEAWFDVDVRPLPEGWSLGADGSARVVLRRIEAGEDVPLLAFMLVAQAFREADRARGRLRWLLRAFERFPGSATLADAMVDAYVERGRLEEALAVSTHRVSLDAGDKRFWKRRASLAAWLSRSAIEAQALEKLLELGPDNEARQRILQIYTYLGQPERALAHALRMAEEAGELAAYERAAYVALENGRPDTAFELLAELAKRSNDPARWYSEIARFALQDLQIDRAIAALERLVESYPDVEDYDRLEGLYRRRDRPRELAALLERRLQWQPDDAGLLQETVSLWVGLGERDRARQALALQRLASENPRPVPHRLTGTDVEQARRFEAQAFTLLRSEQPQPRLLSNVLNNLRPFLGDRRFRRVVEDLLARYPDEPAARKMRLELLDLDRTPAESARVAEELAATYAGDVQAVRAWVDRAAWAGLLDSEIRARQRLAQLQPDDRDNRHTLAELLEADHRYPEAIDLWQQLVDSEGLRSPSLANLVAALFADGRHEVALDWLTRRAADPNATLDDRMAAAEQLFDFGKYDQAVPLLRSILVDRPDDPAALLRLGQIHSWTNEPRSALPYLERRLEVSTADRSEVEHLLGEAYWSVGERDRARQLLARVLDALQAEPRPTPRQRATIARCLVRLDRVEEALPLFRELVAETPDNLDLILDFADLCMQSRAYGEARELVDRARRLDGNALRVLRIDGELLTVERSYDRAAVTLRQVLERGGPDAGTYADLAHASEAGDHWYDALQAFERWRELKTDSINAARSVHRLQTLLAPVAVGSFDYQRTGSDVVQSTAWGGVVPLDADRTRLAFDVGVGRYRGRAAAVAGGTQDITEDLATIDLGVDHRIAGSDRFGVGLSLATGAPSTAVGAFASLLLTGEEPYRSLELHGYVNRVLAEPAAAVGLDGRAHGLELTTYHDSSAGWWFGATARGRYLAIAPPGSGEVGDLQLAGELSVGRALLAGDSAVAGRFRARRTPAGPTSPFLAAPPAQTRDFGLNVWISAQAFRLLGDAQLSKLIPVDERSEYLVAATRLDKHLGHGLGGKLEAWAGRTLSGSGTVWGVDGALTWLPTSAGELTLIGAIGESLNRSGFDAMSHRLGVQFVWRW